MLRGDAAPKIHSLLALFGGIVALVVMHELMGVTSRQIDTSLASASPKHRANPQLFMRQSDPIPQRIDGALRLVFLSDTHGRHAEIPLPLPDGDALFHLGDACNRGQPGTCVNVNKVRCAVDTLTGFCPGASNIRCCPDDDYDDDDDNVGVACLKGAGEQSRVRAARGEGAV